MAASEQAKPEPPSASRELEKFKRLVELQGQLVELARQNERAGKECAALWRELRRAPRSARFRVVRLPRPLAKLSRMALTEITNRFTVLVRTAQIVIKPAAK